MFLKDIIPIQKQDNLYYIHNSNDDVSGVKDKTMNLYIEILIGAGPSKPPVPKRM